MRRATLVVGLGLAIGCAAIRPSGSVLVSDGRYAMGTVLEITLVASDEASGRAALDELFALAERLERVFTVFDAQSAVSRLNRAAGRGPPPVDAELAALLERARQHSELTGGAFDVTVGPLVALWKRAAAHNVLPSATELSAALAHVGWEQVRVVGRRSVLLEGPGVTVDLGGVAKGWALDRMRVLLERRDIDRALFNFGQSSVWALGRPGSDTAWQLLARGPGGGFLGVLHLRDLALSVSGSLGQSVEIGGRRFGHVVDPRTGHALERRRQALVVGPDATLAEALSKALLVLGAEEGLGLVAEQPGCEALLVDAEGGAWRTPGWDSATGFAAF